MKIFLSDDRVFELTDADIKKIQSEMLCNAAIGAHLIISVDKRNYIDQIYNLLMSDTNMSDCHRKRYHDLIIDLLGNKDTEQLEKLKHMELLDK